jgi:hypothetical protein
MISKCVDRSRNVFFERKYEINFETRKQQPTRRGNRGFSKSSRIDYYYNSNNDVDVIRDFKRRLSTEKRYRNQL